MRQYELTVLFHPDLEMNLKPATDKVKKLIEDNGGKITKEVPEGKKRLAYSIQEQEFAVYHYYEVDLPAAAPAKINSVLNITDEILRYLLVKHDERRAKAAAHSAEDGTEEAGEQEDSNEEE